MSQVLASNVASVNQIQMSVLTCRVKASRPARFVVFQSYISLFYVGVKQASGYLPPLCAVYTAAHLHQQLLYFHSLHAPVPVAGAGECISSSCVFESFRGAITQPCDPWRLCTDNHDSSGSTDTVACLLVANALPSPGCLTVLVAAGTIETRQSQ